MTDANIETLLRNCATSPDKSFVADDAAELITAFGKIGTSLTQLRLSQQPGPSETFQAGAAPRPLQ